MTIRLRAPARLALLLSLFIAQHPRAQTLDWEAPLYAQAPPWQVAPFGAGPRGALADTPFMPYWDPLSKRVFLMSDAGEPGIVLVGRAQIDDVVLPVMPPATPWIAKVARSDGAALWTWHLDDYADGDFAEGVVDAAGDVVALGTKFLPDNRYGPFVIKLDAATGAVRWRFDGTPQRTWGTGLALDADGNVLVTAAADRVAQQVYKLARDTGALLWSSGVPNPDDWNDGLVAAESDGGAVVAGGYELTDDGLVIEDGLQVARLRGTDGAVLWSKRFVSTFGVTVHALRILPGGDVALAGGFGNGIELVRLAGATGAVLWQRGDVDAFDMLVDREGRILASGAIDMPGTYIPIGDVQRLDAADGSTLWRRQFPSPHSTSGAWRMQIGVDGQLLVGLSEGEGDIPFEVAALELATGALRWRYAPEGLGDDDTFPVGVAQDAAGAIYFGGFNYIPADDTRTWTTFRLMPIAADTIFLNGLD